jgi:chaperonin GroES
MTKPEPLKRSAKSGIETVEPIGKRVLIRKDDDKKQTKKGIHLPDKIEIPTITGRVVAVSAQVDRDIDYPIRTYDRVLFNPKQGVPVDFEGDNRLWVVPVEDVVAVFRRDSADRANEGADEQTGSGPEGKRA